MLSLSLSLFPSLSRSLFCTLIYFFPPLLSPLATCEPASHVDWQHSSGLRKAAHFFPLFFFFFLVRRCGPYQETQFIAVSLGERGCHSLWLTALRFASRSVGISFKLLCFSYWRRLYCSTWTYVHTLHTYTKTWRSLVSKPFCFHPTLAVILSDGRQSAVLLSTQQVKFSFANIFVWVIVLFFGEEVRVKKIKC